MTKFSDYDVIGFDLDNTILQYNLSTIFPLQYSFLSNYLVEEKGYSRNVFPFDLSEEDIDFFERGLFLDLTRGNILYLRKDGFIIKATHGTELMTDELIRDSYGESRIWPAIVPIIKDKLSLWDSQEARTFLDFTDSIVPLIYAKAIDFIDQELKGNDCSKHQAWPDVLEAIIKMYEYDSLYYQTINSDLSKYLHPCDSSVISWLKKLKDHAKLILITGIEHEVAKITLPFCLGKNYLEIFDLFIYEAKKPGFFTQNRPFLTIDGKRIDEIQMGSHCKNGNWPTVYKLFQKYFNSDPKALYIGDNALQDVYAPTIIPLKLDTVAVIEEVAAEGLFPDFPCPHKKYLCSKFWGPYLSNTITGDLLSNCTKLIIPSLQVLAKKPINYSHTLIST